MLRVFCDCSGNSSGFFCWVTAVVLLNNAMLLCSVRHFCFYCTLSVWNIVISDQWLASVYNVVCFVICNKSFTCQDAWEFTSVNIVSDAVAQKVVKTKMYS